MTGELKLLTLTAASIGFFHTLMGPDHYLPFIVMAKARQWSMMKTTLITVLCGLGHVLSSIVLGLIGVMLGVAVTRLEIIESFRGNIAAWALIAFGLIYFIWGLRQAWRGKSHMHIHNHGEEDAHNHEHNHTNAHIHVHDSQKSQSITPWVLFVIFVFGPCEPLIPILMYPAAKSSLFGVIWVSAVFSSITIITMLGVVLAGTLGVNFIPFKRLERYTHALAGAAISLSGMAIQFLGL
ncbi:MAG: sulfite exporter TauE/SafE family protein [bacterium]